MAGSVMTRPSRTWRPPILNWPVTGYWMAGCSWRSTGQLVKTFHVPEPGEQFLMRVVDPDRLPVKSFQALTKGCGARRPAGEAAYFPPLTN